MNGLLDKEAKSIRIRVFEFASPAVDTGIHRVEKWLRQEQRFAS